jgi:hypothetical protein
MNWNYFLHTGNMGMPTGSGILWSVASRLVGCGRKQGRLLIDAPSSSRSIMSTAPSTYTSQSNFVSIFNAALESYKRKTKKDLASHPLLPNLQPCESPEAVLAVLREQVPGASNQSQNDDDGLTRWVAPTVNVLYSFSGTIGQGVGLVNFKRFFRRGEYFSPNIFLFTGFSTCKYIIRRDRGPPFGQCPTISPFCELF